MKIAGIYPQRLKTDFSIQHAVSEPYGLEKILAIAKQEGHEVELFIPAEENENGIVPISDEAFIDRIAEYKPDIAAFSMYTCQYPFGKKVAEELKKRQNVLTIAGNRYPTHLRYPEQPFDFFVLKEGELTFRELLARIDKKQQVGDVKGISFGNVITEARERNFNLDSLPNALRFPVILNQVYRGISIPPLSSNPHYAIMEYSRCCYNSCKFCDNKGFWGNKVIFRSPDRVVDEMFELKERGVDVFYFIDLNFTAFPEKTLELCKRMTDRRLGASWYCMSNIATLDGRDDVLRALKEAGCYRISWGVESTDDNALRKMNKRVGRDLTTNEQTGRVLQKSLDAGILNLAYYIIGFPWEYPHSILKDAGKLKHLAIHQLNVGIFTPIPLSRFYDKMAGEYKFNTNLEKHDRSNLIYNHKMLTNRTVKALQQRIYHDFYKSPEYLERLRATCTIDPRFRQAFNDYFQFAGMEARAA
ncbi:B12-binding domain-containing radical SAM protein [Candidatus Pacearchaeota archaeon]|nr:B12-binding domain-containing radical SAM protein [Candidatus Pacearchaeota archaeon]